MSETMRDRESRARLGEVSRELRIGKDRLDLTLPTHHPGPRKLLKEGILTKAKSGRKRRLILLSNILYSSTSPAVEGYTTCPSPSTNSKYTLHETAHVPTMPTYASIVPTLGAGRPSYYVLPTSEKHVHGQKQSHRRGRGSGWLSVIRGVRRWGSDLPLLV
ncbi:hypothetical protein BKA82DRAFT_4135873 [Pisolithus tinctorius]|nr:hypothetical protein BKA82DRAFT_4135873 [Pisolithus tinctorius]